MAEAKAALLDLIELTVKEPGCELFTMAQNNDPPEEFVLWEIFKSQSALQEHLEKSYTKKFFSLNLTESIAVIHLTELKR